MIEPRRFREVKDVQAMQRLLMEGRKADNGTYYIHPGDLSWWLYYPPLEGDFWDYIYLWDDPGQPGRLLGWCLLTPDWVAIDVYTLPALRGSELARDMYLWAEDQATALAQEHGKSTLHSVWIRHGDDVLEGQFKGRGFQLGRGYVCLERPLEGGIPPVELPEGFILRSCKGEPEVSARAKAQYGSFGSSAPFERYVERFTKFMRSPVYNPELDIVAIAPAGEVGAFCIVWLDPLNKHGHFEPVGTHPDYQRKGLGRAIMVEGLRRLRDAGMRSADVVTTEDNLAAIKLYESVGFHTVNRMGTYAKDV